MDNLRIRILSIIFFSLFLLCIARLFYWQVVKGGELSSLARLQYQTNKVVSSSRGNILAKDLSLFSAKSEGWLVYASPAELTEKPKVVAEKLAAYFVENPEDRGELLNEIDRIEGLLKKSESIWVPIKRKITDSIKKSIEAHDIKGIGFESEEIRIYPEASTAAHILGFVGKDEGGADRGYFGLEGYYDLALSGKPGFLAREKDAKGSPILLGNSIDISGVTGTDLVTSIDKRVQLTVEESLIRGIEKYSAKGGSVIVMNPKNGEITGMASYPSYDPREYWKYSDNLFKNPAISDTFEPGSVFKVIVMAAGLDKGVVTPQTQCDICSGPLRVDKYSIETWNRKYHPGSTMTDVIVNSDNVGMAYVGGKLGADTLYDYLASFGIGEVTGVDLQGEVAVPLREKGSWNIVDLATASFGQGVVVTPIQMIRAVTAIANDGVLVNPSVVQKILGNGWEQSLTRAEGKRVISSKAASEIKAMMAEAAKRGESKWTNLPGFKVAGKTGTAQIPIAGHYDEDKTIASFVGFAPYDNPKFIMLVTLREPQSSPWASETAAPLWYSIANDLFSYMGIQPEN